MRDVTKRLRVLVPREVVVRECDLRLLDVIERATVSRRRGATLTSRELAGEMGSSEATVHRSVVVSVDRGFLEVRKNRSESGAQLANTYLLTEEGRAVLAAARDQGLA